MSVGGIDDATFWLSVFAAALTGAAGSDLFLVEDGACLMADMAVEQAEAIADAAVKRVRERLKNGGLC